MYFNLFYMVYIYIDQQGKKRKLPFGEEPPNDTDVTVPWTSEDDANQIANDTVWNSVYCNIPFVQGRGEDFFKLVKEKQVVAREKLEIARKKNKVTEMRALESANQPVKLKGALKRARKPKAETPATTASISQVVAATHDELPLVLLPSIS